METDARRRCARARAPNVGATCPEVENLGYDTLKGNEAFRVYLSDRWTAFARWTDCSAVPVGKV